MTLTETEEEKETNTETQHNTTSIKSHAVGETLRNSLWEALDNHRVTSGVINCANKLSCNPGNVMLCVLPEAESENLSVHIQHTLIEAICLENDIRIVKVKSAKSLHSSLCGFQVQIKCRCDITRRYIPSDVSCILVEFPPNKLSDADDRLLTSYDEIIEKSTGVPQFNLPPNNICC